MDQTVVQEDIELVKHVPNWPSILPCRNGIPQLTASDDKMEIDDAGQGSSGVIPDSDPANASAAALVAAFAAAFDITPEPGPAADLDPASSVPPVSSHSGPSAPAPSPALASSPNTATSPAPASAPSPDTAPAAPAPALEPLPDATPVPAPASAPSPDTAPAAPAPGLASSPDATPAPVHQLRPQDDQRGEEGDIVMREMEAALDSTQQDDDVDMTSIQLPTMHQRRHPVISSHASTSRGTRHRLPSLSLSPLTTDSSEDEGSRPTAPKKSRPSASLSVGPKVERAKSIMRGRLPDTINEVIDLTKERVSMQAFFYKKMIIL